jgi:hypothetical protein
MAIDAETTWWPKRRMVAYSAQQLALIVICEKFRAKIQCHDRNFIRAFIYASFLVRFQKNCWSSDYARNPIRSQARKKGTPGVFRTVQPANQNVPQLMDDSAQCVAQNGGPEDPQRKEIEMRDVLRSLNRGGGAGGLPPKKKVKRRALQFVTMYIELCGQLPKWGGAVGFPSKNNTKNISTC